MGALPEWTPKDRPAGEGLVKILGTVRKGRARTLRKGLGWRNRGRTGGEMRGRSFGVRRSSLAIVALVCGCSSGDSGTTPTSPTVSLGFAALASSTAGSRVAFPVQPAIQLEDAAGKAVAKGGVVVTASLDAGTVYGSSSATTNAQGIAVFTDLAIGGTKGIHTLTFSSPGLSSVMQLVNLTAGPASSVSGTGDKQTWLAGSPVPITPSMKAVDADGNAVSGATLKAEVIAGGGSVTGATGATNSLGEFTLGSWTLGPVPGVNNLRITIDGATTTWVISATAVAPAASCGQDVILALETTYYGWVKAGACVIKTVSDYETTFQPKTFTGPVAGGTYFYDRYLIDVPAGAIVRVETSRTSFLSQDLIAFTPGGAPVAWQFLNPLTINNATNATVRYQLLLVPFRTGETGTYQIIVRRLT